MQLTGELKSDGYGAIGIAQRSGSAHKHSLAERRNCPVPDWQTFRKKPAVLDYAKEQFGDQFVEDVKAVQNVIYIFLPLPVFWALYDQQVKTAVL